MMEILQLMDSAVRLSTPLLLAALAGLFSERSGIFDIGLEGKMLAGAFAAGAFSAMAGMPVSEGGWGMTYGAAWVGMFAAIITSIFLAMIHAFASITLRGNQLISGVAINFFAAGTTVLIGKQWFHAGGNTPSLSGNQRFGPIELPFAEKIGEIPFLGPIYEGLISGHNLIVYMGMLAVPISWWILFRTRFGLRLRAVGENPGAVDTAGISVIKMRYMAVLIAGILCGISGAYLSLGTAAAGFTPNMSASKGFIALAALIFAKWSPKGVLGATLLFGFLEAIGNKYQSVNIADIIDFFLYSSIIMKLFYIALYTALAAYIFNRWKQTAVLFALPVIGFLWVLNILFPIRDFLIPVQLMQALPYILTVVILAGFIGKAIPPKAGGEPYVKER